VRVALDLPLAFTLQTDEVVERRVRRLRGAFIAEVVLALILLLFFILDLTWEVNNVVYVSWWWTFISILLTVVLGIVLRKLGEH